MIQEKKIQGIIPEHNILDTDVVLKKVQITPELAKRWLERNIDNNRRLSGRNIEKMIVDFENGNWNPENGETIKFDPDGVLIDGQHRLKAIQLHNKPVISHVLLNASKRSFTTIDGGKKRSAADILTIAGFTYAREIPIVLQKSEAILDGRYVLNTPLTGSQILDLATQNKEDLSYVCKKANTLYMRFKGVSKSEYGIFMRVFKKVDTDSMLDFMDYLSLGSGLEQGHPLYSLRNTLINDQSLTSRRLSTKERYAHIILAWNYFFQGKQIIKLKWKLDEEFPTVHGLKAKKS